MDKVDLNSDCKVENQMDSVGDNCEIIIVKNDLNDQKCVINCSGDINEINSIEKEDDLTEKGNIDCVINKIDSEHNQEDESIKTPLLSKELSGDCQNVEISSEVKKVSVEVRDVDSTNKPLNESQTKSNAFTERQECDSNTEDSESDSSSSSESESDSSSVSKESTSSSDDDDDAPIKKKTSSRGGNEGKAVLNEGIKKKRPSTTRYKNELDMEDLPPIEDLHITVLEDECEPLGTICSIVNQLVVIGSLPNKPALNLDSILFNKDGTCLGQIFDVFGPVKTPFYTIRFNSKADIEAKGIQVGQMVYCAPQTPHTKYVFVYQLMKQKGSDASWKHNYEVPESQMDFSDDEEEKKAKRRHQQRTRGRPKGPTDEQNFPKKKQNTSGFVNNYSQYCNNEWYRARVSEMNQFNNINRSGQMNRSQQSGFDSGGEMSGSQSSFPSSRPLIRPPTSNLWNKPPQSGPNNYANNQEYPQNIQPYFSNKNYGNIRGCAQPFMPMNPPTFECWSQSQPNHQGPFRVNNTRQSGLIPPRPLTIAPPPLPRPSVPLNNYPWSSQPPKNNNSNFN